MKNHEFQELVDRNLSELVWDERKRQCVLNAISEEEKPVKKLSTTFILVAAILCISVTALAAGLIFSQKYDAGKVANKAMETQYGITAELLSLFHRSVEENADGTFTVIYEAPQADFPTEQMGDYSVLVKGDQAVITWSNEGKDTNGGLMAEAFGAEQLRLLSHDYANSMQTLLDAGKIGPKTSASATSNPRLQGEIEWTEEDQAEADRALAEAAATEEERLSDISRAEAACSLTVERATIMARDAIVQEYKLTGEQAEKLNHEPGSTYITYQDDQPLVHLLFWLWQREGDAFTEKDGQYWVTINLKQELIDDIIYDSGLAGNG